MDQPFQSPRQNGSCLLEDGRWLIPPNLLGPRSLCESPGKKMLFNCPVLALHWLFLFGGWGALTLGRGLVGGAVGTL